MNFQQPSESRHVFNARYDGTCWNCGSEIWEGDEVTYDPTGDLVHEACVAPQVPDVCPDCNMTLPASGICGVCR